MKQRCINCKKLLAIGAGNFAIKCPRCKTLNHINTQQTQAKPDIDKGHRPHND
ncbi:zinc finger domain-containing protein, LSD1 subclass [Moraxella cuniculi DSM 21768]|uniref:Zinc finger domain-containing protein, LSD1 subclass n=1 Tax=Moraxella cuniculi DSM 21768 TaxID=1122245 RepID=A0A1N7DJ20_9GAMM|nr:Com family DNA-binding transcriptional regulator [Moraxella cuniculi]SIR75791.1 zinc finger domain-containing protein, LSD1 subclass [Moraxella cuniculi DSM 21768]